VTSNHDQRRGAPIPRPFAADQADGVSTLIELAVAMTPPVTLPRVRDPAPPAPAPLAGSLAEAPAYGRPQTRPATSRGRRFAAFTPVQDIGGHVRSFAPAKEQQQERKRLSFLTRGPWPLLGILVVQAGLSLRLIWSNTAFQDEALYMWAGHLEIAHWLRGTPIPAFPPYLSGAPVIYPPIGAIADSYGGLAAARIMSLCFMIIATMLVYLTAGRLLDRTAAVYAAVAFALLGPTQSLAFATYDAMALMLLAMSAWLAVRASSRHPEPWLLVSGLVMALANATKYASALWDPAVVALAAAASWDAGRWRRLARGTRIGVYALIALAAALFRFGGPSYVQGILFTTLNRSSSVIPPASIAGDAFNYIGPILCLSLLAVIVSFKSSPRIRFLCLSVAVSCLLAPANQARIQTLTSLHKHVDFGAWFAAIGAGYVIAKASRLDTERTWRIAIAVATVLPLTLISFNVSGDLYHSWPPSAKMTAKLQPLLRPDRAHYLIEAATVADYYLHADVYPGQVVPLWGCMWWDRTMRRELTGPSACTAAIRAHYFQVIETDGSTGPVTKVDDATIWHAIWHSRAYRLVYRAPEQFHPQNVFQIWQLSSGRHLRSPASPVVAGSNRDASGRTQYPILELETWIAVAFGGLVAAISIAIRFWWRRGKGVEVV
jgi:4-amino-4-deoxy-L-arabinose transferase-like glycosyltransferase